ncbi:MAG: AMP-dependent synthetase/ligase [Verrucomicrobiota bacterium]
MAGTRTIGALWRNAAARGSPRPPYLAEREGTWVEVSWPEAARRVDDLANGLLALGVRKGDAFAIMAATSLEWCLFDFALGLIGAIGAPVYANSSPRDTCYVIGHSEAVGVLAEDDEQLAKIDEVRGDLPDLRHVLGFADLPELEARGREHAASYPDALDAAAAAVDEEDLFTYIYTSGTTGPPKGCMIRHRNYYEMATVVDKLEHRFVGPEDTLLLYLPLAHNYGRLIHLQAIHVGYTLALCRDPLRVAEALVAVRPTTFPSVPRVYEKAHTAVASGLADARGPRRTIANWALGVGREVSRRRQAGETISHSLAVRHRIADRLVYSKVKERFGGRLRLASSGGAPLAREVIDLFAALDLPIYEGYGLTECTTACSTNRPDAFKFGTVGKPLPGVEARVADDGELEIRGPTVFAGYLKDPEATRAVLGEDGWLRTGDIAEIDEDGFITITDRKKDVIVTSGGKNVAPQNIENELKSSRYVSQAIVLGDRRPYVTALITLDQDEVAKWHADGGGDTDTLVQGIVDEVNRNRSRYEQIRRFAVLPREFSAEEGEITPTLKLRRRVVQEHFADAIERLYS